MSENLRIEFEPGSDEGSHSFVVAIRFLDSNFFSKHAVLTLHALVITKCPEPSSARKDLLFREFVVTSDVHRIEIPLDEFKVLSYAGENIDIRLYVSITMEDGPFRNARFEEELELKLESKPHFVSTARDLICPSDAFSFSDNLWAIALDNRLAALLLVVAVIAVSLGGVVLAVVGEVYLGGEGREFGVLVVCGTVGALSAGFAIWKMAHRQLRSYAELGFRPFERKIRMGDSCRISEILEGVSRIDLNGVTVRIVACNMEKAVNIVAGGSGKSEGLFSEPCRAVRLYEKTVDRIPFGESIEGYFDDTFSFDPMFAALYPPMSLSDAYGLDIYWELQFIHPTLVDHKLVGPTDIFHFEDFVSAMPEDALKDVDPGHWPPRQTLCPP